MARQGFVPFLFLLLTFLGFVRPDQFLTRQLESWNGGFKGSYDFRSPWTVYGGWNMVFEFDKPITKLEIWRAQVVTLCPNGQFVVLKNMNWNKNIRTNESINGVFVVRYNQYPPSPPKVTFPAKDCECPDKPPPTRKPDKPREGLKYNYPEVLHKSILFYEAQRSGKLPESNRIKWRGDAYLYDKGHNGEDLTGGWFDAGDNVKFNLPMASSVTLLSWGLIQYRDAYRQSGELANMLDSIKWPLDYFIKCHVAENVIYGQVGTGDIDHSIFARPEEMTPEVMPRPVFKLDQSHPGSDLAGEMAAAMAAGSISFRVTDRAYADKLLSHAKQINNFAVKYRGKYSDVISDAHKYYKSTEYRDELAWAGAWLYWATMENSYLVQAKQFTQTWKPWAVSWDDKNAGANLLLYKLTGEAMYKNAVERFLNDWLPGGSIPYTPRGLAWRTKFGSNRYAANAAFLALSAADLGLRPSAYRQFAEKQIHFMLGDTGRSFVVGFGRNPPVRPHHMASSCPSPPATCDFSNLFTPGPNPHVLYGALVGGPDQNGWYQDKREDYVLNEVTCDYNAGFQSAVAGLLQLKLAK